MKAAALSIRYHPGWFGSFTRFQVTRAYVNGSRVEKSKMEDTDTTPLGMQGTILGSTSHPTRGIGYFVEWDHRPRTAVFVIAWKLKVVP